jgi:hypothetical protein
MGSTYTCNLQDRLKASQDASMHKHGRQHYAEPLSTESWNFYNTKHHIMCVPLTVWQQKWDTLLMLRGDVQDARLMLRDMIQDILGRQDAVSQMLRRCHGTALHAAGFCQAPTVSIDMMTLVNGSLHIADTVHRVQAYRDQLHQNWNSQ